MKCVVVEKWDDLLCSREVACYGLGWAVVENCCGLP